MNSYDTLPLDELQRAAGREARDFTLPFGWDEGRDLRYGVTMDDETTKIIEDALDLTSHSETSHTLHLSMPEAATFLEPDGAILALALGSLWRRHRMLADNVVKQLSLAEHQPRPVLTAHVAIDQGRPLHITFTRERIIATKLDLTTVETILQEGSGPHSDLFTRLQGLASALYRYRNGINEGSRGRQERLSFMGGAMIVHECVLAMTSLVGPYMHMRGTDVIVRRSKNNSRHQIISGSSSVTYANLHVPIKANLRRPVDMVNQANLLTTLNDEPQRFGIDVLRSITRPKPKYAG